MHRTVMMNRQMKIGFICLVSIVVCHLAAAGYLISQIDTYRESVLLTQTALDKLDMQIKSSCNTRDQRLGGLLKEIKTYILIYTNRLIEIIESAAILSLILSSLEGLIAVMLFTTLHKHK